MEMSREKAIDEILVSLQINTGMSYWLQKAREGFKGFENMTNEELEQAYDDEIGNVIKIVDYKEYEVLVDIASIFVRVEAKDKREAAQKAIREVQQEIGANFYVSIEHDDSIKEIEKD